MPLYSLIPADYIENVSNTNVGFLSIGAARHRQKA
jgi:hypothetical protein